MSFRSKPVGWRYESQRHSLAARGIRSFAMKDSDMERSFRKLKEKHKVGGEIDENIRKLDERIGEIRREMESVQPTAEERRRRDVNALTAEDTAKAEKYVQLEKMMRSALRRRKNLEVLRPAYFASKTSKMLDKGIEDEEQELLKKGGGLRNLPTSSEMLNLDVESLKIGRPIMVMDKDPKKEKSVVWLDEGEMRKLVNWQQINRRRAKEYLKEHGTLKGFSPTKNFEASVEGAL
jgi:hypothetical protein